MVEIERRADKRRLHKWRWRFLTAWVVLFTGVVAYILHDASHQRTEITQNATQAKIIAIANTLATCTLKRDLIHRRANTRALLKKYPHGSFGFPRKYFLIEINRYTKTIAAMNIVACPRPSHRHQGRPAP